jgi:hypothetical protein
MADKIMLNFRCPAELLDAIDTLGQERHPSKLRSTAAIVLRPFSTLCELVLRFYLRVWLSYLHQTNL